MSWARTPHDGRWDPGMEQNSGKRNYEAGVARFLAESTILIALCHIIGRPPWEHASDLAAQRQQLTCPIGD